jgi:23S rRNA (guanosine2251-2'-O)-methyltransferase
VVLPSHRSALLSPTVAKVAAGAIEYLPMTVVPGVPAALQRLATLGIWRVGLVGESTASLYEVGVGEEPVALVVGSEGSGLATLTRKRCDTLASIPQHGELSSLNVATAGAIACFEVARRRAAPPGPGPSQRGSDR